MKDFTLIVARLRKTDWDLYRIIDEFGFIPVSDEAYPQLKEGADAHDRNVMAPHRKIRAFTLGRSKIFVRRCDNDKNYLAIRLDAFYLASENRPVGLEQAFKLYRRTLGQISLHLSQCSDIYQNAVYN